MSSESILATVPTPMAGMAVDVVTGSGFAVTFDAADAGDARQGPSPIETVLGNLAACTAMDVASILRKKRQEARGYQVAVTGERADDHPRVYTRIVVEHRVVGDVEPEALRRSIELSATKYCPVNAMLARGVEIEHRYRLWQGAAEGDGIGARVAVTGPSGTTVD
jgi:putative redox protein